ncbi:hypothetical protein [Desulfonema magnum]|uniref:Uncharacterized protein n=1 Tax=Desulfonema magnum TaxID=45655 RepID=A0A975GKZ0_9BACT|nr:hypothetical protein [Desulfonema magnum]QTA85227.1 Uncharacterized protein dnm_012320 [Desulfonema magnum]
MNEIQILDSFAAAMCEQMTFPAFRHLLKKVSMREKELENAVSAVRKHRGSRLAGGAGEGIRPSQPMA